jgi:uncharacterized protein RhaS with RHS repeats
VLGQAKTRGTASQTGYPALNRLTDEALSDTSWACTPSVPAGLTFAYDAVGNLTRYCDVNGTTTYRYHAATTTCRIWQNRPAPARRR